MKMSTKIINLRGSKVGQVHRGSVLNMFEEAHVIKSRGALGTGFTYAPVCRVGGKPSTGFPPRTRRADHLQGMSSQISLHAGLVRS